MGFVLTPARSAEGAAGLSRGKHLKPHPVDACSFKPQITPFPLPEGSPRTMMHSSYSPRRISTYSPGRSRATIPRAVSLDKLVLRKGKHLESEKLGNILMGAEVLILETDKLKDGSVRARVGKAHKATVEPLGWVTSVKLDLTGDAETKLQELEDDDGRGRSSSHRRMSPDSMASRIAQRRLHSHRAAQNGAQPTASYLMGAHLPMVPKVNDYNAVIDRMRWEADPASKPTPPPPPPAEGWLSAAALTARADAHRVEALAVEAAMFDSVEERLGFVLLHNTRSEEDLLKEYGSGKGKREMGKEGFRKMVRSLGKEGPMTAGMSSLLQDKQSIPDSEIDEVFVAFNSELLGGNGGNLEAKELSVGFAKLMDVVKRKRFVDAAAKAANLRKVAAQHEEAASLVVTFEKEQAKLAKMRTGTVASRMGDLLVAKDINVDDLKHKWDSDGSGKLGPDEFVHHALELGLQATKAEAESLFNELDKDRSKSLIHRELVAALSRLQVDARNKADADRQQLAVVTKAQKASEQSQLKARAMKMV